MQKHLKVFILVCIHIFFNLANFKYLGECMQPMKSDSNILYWWVSLCPVLVCFQSVNF